MPMRRGRVAGTDARDCGRVVVGQHSDVVGARLLLSGQLPHQPPRLNIGLGRKHVKTSPGSIRGRAEATYEAVLRQRDANSLRNLETNRPQLQHDAAADTHRALYLVRLGVVESNNVTRTYVTGCDILCRHVPTVGACRMTFPRVTPEGLLSVSDGRRQHSDIRLIET
jgi:hypothetical protein